MFSAPALTLHFAVQGVIAGEAVKSIGINLNSNTWYGDSSKARLTGTWYNRNVAQQAENLWAEEGAIPNVEEFVKKNFGTEKTLLWKKCDNISGISASAAVSSDQSRCCLQKFLNNKEWVTDSFSYSHHIQYL